MLKDADFFDVDQFPEMTFHSTRVERTGETTLKVDGRRHPARRHAAL